MAASGVSVGGAAQYSIDFNATTTSVNAGSDASLDDLHDDAITVEAWINVDSWGEGGAVGYVVSKGNTVPAAGWILYLYSVATGVGFIVRTASAPAEGKSGTGAFSPDSAWHHIAGTWDDATYTNPRIWIDGTEQTNSTVARNGAIVTDASLDVIIGQKVGGAFTIDGEIAWVRISDNIRYTGGFTPDAKDAPPAVDGNTVEQWNFNDGAGVTAAAEVNGSNDGTITDGSWTAL